MLKYFQLYTNLEKFSGKPILFTMIHVIANTLKDQVSTHTVLIYTEMLIRCYALSILDVALDFTDFTFKQDTPLQELFSLSVICLVFNLAKN